jgi:hypothetical protein
MRRWIYGVIALGILSGTAFAADTTRGPLPFEAYDKNKDGVISEEEFNATKAERMSERAEAGMPMRNAANSPDFAYFDTNKDGKITKEELLQGQLKRRRGY